MLRVFPSTRSRNPSSHILAVLLIFLTKLVAQRRFFVEEDEKIHQDDDCERISNQHARELGKENSAAKQNQPSPEIHRVADVAIRTADHQTSRCVKRSRRAFSHDEKIHEAANCDDCTWDERKKAEPTRRVLGRKIRRALNCEPLWHQPEPQQHKAAYVQSAAKSEEYPLAHDAPRILAARSIASRGCLL